MEIQAEPYSIEGIDISEVNWEDFEGPDYRISLGLS